jgi:uncharacterized protein HemX
MPGLMALLWALGIGTGAYQTWSQVGRNKTERMGLEMQDKWKLAETEAQKLLARQQTALSEKYMKEASDEGAKDRIERYAMRREQRMSDSADRQTALMASMVGGFQGANQPIDTRFITSILQ